MTDGTPRSSWMPVVTLVLLVWVVALVAGYYVGHKPFGGGTAEAIGRAALDLLAVGLVVVLGGAIGFVLSNRLPFDFVANLADLEIVAIQALLGLGMMSLAVFGLVAIGLVPVAWQAWVITLGGVAILYRPALGWLRGLRDGLRGVIPDDGWGRFLAIAAMTLLGMALVAGLAPPTKWDALVYHLTGPATIIEAGGFVGGADNHFFGFPQLVELLYLWLMLLRGLPGTAAAPLHWAFGGLMLLLMIGISRRLSGGSRVAWLAAIVLLTSDSFWGEFAWTYVDLASAAYTLAAFAVMSANPRAWLVGGILTGFALSTKYTLAGPAIGLGILVLWRVRENGVAGSLWTATRFTGVAMAVLAPWLVKNALLDANPIAPLVFPTAQFDTLDQQYYLRPGTGLPLWQLAIAPVHATVVGREGGAPYGASAGALVVALLPTVFVRWRRRSNEARRFVSDAFLIVVPAYLVWLVGNSISWFLVQTRLLFPIFPGLALVGALGVEGLRDVRWPLDVGWLARSIVSLVVALTLVGGVLNFMRGGSARVVLGLQDDDAYLTNRLGWYYPAMRALEDLPEDTRVLFLWEPRTHYCEADCTPDSLLNRWWHDRQLQPDPLAIGDAWRAQGYTHVLIHEAGLQFLVEEEPFELVGAEDVAALDRLREEAWVEVWQGGEVYTLYTWRTEGAADGG